MPQIIQLRRGTAASWTSANPVLALGEPGVETDTRKVKYGDGTTTWTALPYASVGTGGGSTVTIDADGTLVVDGTTVELATDAQVSAKLDSTGTATNSTAIGGVAITGTPAAGQIPTATSSTAATWQTPTGGGVADASASVKGVVQLAGDLGGSAAAPTVPGLAGKAPLASPALTGTPTVPTASPGTNTTQVASTAFAAAAVAVETARATAAEGVNAAALAALPGTYGPIVGSNAWLKAWASAVTDTAIGAVTVDSNSVATSFAVLWPDGTAGAFTATTVNATWQTVDAWTVTYIGGTTKTVTQPAVTRDSNGAVTSQPALAVS